MRDKPNLASLPGLAFTTDRDGIIVDIGAANWNRFAARNDAPELTSDAVLGQSLFDFVAGAQVQDHLHDTLERLSTDPSLSWVLPFRCDAPDVRRTMRQFLRPMFCGAACSGFIFHTVEIYELKRRPVGMFQFKRLRKLTRESGALLPPMTMCSWCQRVRGDATGGKWVEADAFEAAGGSADVVLSHGICGDCLELAADLFLWS